MRVISVFALALFASCVHTSELVPTVSGSTRFSKADSFYVSLPRDGEYEGRPYVGSGLQTARAIEAELLRHTSTVRVGSAVELREAARAAARGEELRFVVVPTILHWEDRATEWSGILDKLEVRLDVVEVEGGTTLHSVGIKGKSKWATFGGDHPQDLLPEPLEEFFSGLFPESSAPSTTPKPTGPGPKDW